MKLPRRRKWCDPSIRFCFHIRDTVSIINNGVLRAGIAWEMGILVATTMRIQSFCPFGSVLDLCSNVSIVCSFGILVISLYSGTKKIESKI